MSVLGRKELILRLSNNDLSISPILSKDQIGAASIDLRMGNIVLMVRARGSSHVDPAIVKATSKDGSPHKIETGQRQKHERYEIPFESRFLLHPGSLALVPTLEWLKLPPDLQGAVTARSTWAREGLSIATATFIEPNYQGIITLELANLGQIPIALYPGLSLAQIAFYKTKGETKRSSEAQFTMSFEPTQGNIAKPIDFPFIPEKNEGAAS